MYQSLENIVKQALPYYTEGKAVSYIPALSDIKLDQISVCLIDGKGHKFRSGEADVVFGLQSISKIISFMWACHNHGLDKVLTLVDVEPTGDPFNSIVRLEVSEPGKPFNPMINAGAITISSILPGEDSAERVSGLQQFLEKLMGGHCAVNDEVFQSEWVTAYRNRAIANYLKANGYLVGDVEVALETYLRQCAIEIDVEALAMIGLVIANDGKNPMTGQQIVDKKLAKVTKALMMTCGMYNASGKYAAFVGIPAKSGVSGGILCAVPNGQIENLSGPIGIGVFSPAIDGLGNSVVGMKFLEMLSLKYEVGVF